ncbi:hypothetical protein AB669_03695 [Pedobacter sp. BMA]|nr:hypothetical protein AB669_03695 [Pedobacter sp. BMA]
MFLVVYLIRLIKSGRIRTELAFFEHVLPRLEAEVDWYADFLDGVAYVKCQISLTNASMQPALGVVLSWYGAQSWGLNWTTDPLIDPSVAFGDVAEGENINITLTCEVPSYYADDTETYSAFVNLLINYEQKDGKKCEQILTAIQCMDKDFDHAGYVNRYDFDR